MISIRAAVKDEWSTPGHQVVEVWAGPDPDHRVHCGHLTMTEDQAAALIARLDVAEGIDEPITPEIASHVLWHFGEGGQPPGGFTKTLIMLAASADPFNRARLAQGFPALVRAVRIAQDEPDGIARLRRIARGEAG